MAKKSSDATPNANEKRTPRPRPTAEQYELAWEEIRDAIEALDAQVVEARESGYLPPITRLARLRDLVHKQHDALSNALAAKLVGSREKAARREGRDAARSEAKRAKAAARLKASMEKYGLTAEDLA